MLAHAAKLGRGRELTCCDGEGSETLARSATLGRGRGLTCCDGEGIRDACTISNVGPRKRGGELSVRSGESVLVLRAS